LSLQAVMDALMLAHRGGRLAMMVISSRFPAA
jgi:hypothetical protein